MIDELRRIGRTPGPMIAGPWVSEIGFELLYWIPFLQWAVGEGLIPAERLFVLSRGGAGHWYAGVTSRYLELYDLMTPAELRAGNVERIAEQTRIATTIGLRRGQRSQKQLYLSPWERYLCTRAARRAGLRKPAIVHPSLMYQAFRRSWKYGKRDPYTPYVTLARLQAMPRPCKPADLPASYVAMKWYSSEALPDGPETRTAIMRWIDRAARTDPIVLLETRTRFDDHGECQIADHPRVQRLIMTPRDNLETQTAVIAHAKQFVGTYGGFAYLAPILKVPTLGVYTARNFRSDHLRLMRECARRVLGTSFDVTSLKAAARGAIHESETDAA